MKPFYIIMTAILILLVATSIDWPWNSNNLNSVRVMGIVSPRCRNVNVIFRGVPWELVNATMTDYMLSFYSLIIIIFCSSHTKTTVNDARYNNDLPPFDQSGFMLLKNQKSFAYLNDNDYHENLHNVVKELFPSAIKIEILKSRYRGFGDNVPVPLVHLDYFWTPKHVSVQYPQFADLLLSNNTNISIIGTWKPIEMKKPVCKDSLVLLDASTLSFENVKSIAQDYNSRLSDGTVVHENTSVAAPIISENQKWYYYSNMKNDEMIIFNHYRSDVFKQVAHASFTPKECHKNHEKRKSVESKILIQFENVTSVV